jgi:3-keto-disaccharide hydrolase
MTRWTTFTIALLFSAIGTYQYAGTASGQAGGGWITLFDGKNLDHWQGDGTATFKIEDGSIVAVDKKDPKAVAAYLVSKESYKDFELRAEFWVSEEANSGIFIRCEPGKIGAKTCYEYNIFDKRPDPTYGTASIVYIGEVDPMPKAGGKWSTMEIGAKGRHLTLTFDGKKTVDVRNGLFDKGHIALQFGVGTVKFRKVEIKPL